MNPILDRCFIMFASTLTLTTAFTQNAFITNRGASSVSVINTQTNTVITTIPVHENPSSVVVSADGLRAYIGYYTATNNYVTVINTSTNSVIGDIPIPGASTFGSVIDVNPDGKTLYSASIDSVYAISTSTLAITGGVALGKGNSIQGMAVTTDGNTIYVNGYQKVFVIDAKTLVKKDSIIVPNANFYQLAINSNSTKLYGADKLLGGLHIIDLKTKNITRLLFSTTVTDCVCVSLDGKRVYASNYTDSSICVVDGISDTLIQRIKVTGGAPLGISVTPDGKHVYVANFYSNNVNDINTETFAINATVKVGKNPAAVGKFIVSSDLLPVKLAGFGASLSGGDVMLQWTTASETNTSYFSIERSIDGAHFTPIAKVTASGNSSIGQRYRYKDASAASLPVAKSLYYRLVIVDKDGSASTSSVASVLLLAKKAAMLIMPNPVKEKLLVRLTDISGEARITITDMKGKKWYESNNKLNGSKDVSVAVSGLPTGTYVLRVSGGATLQQKFIKQ